MKGRFFLQARLRMSTGCARSRISTGCVSLPHDIIIDILSRLPVKSLCRFRCVCKRWLALIFDPQFVKLHLNKTNRHKIIFTGHSLYSIDLDDAVSAVKIDFPLKEEGEMIYTIGSCKGLLCLIIACGAYVLLNPSTRQSKRIPDYQKESFSNAFRPDIDGFGYVESTDDYKLVKIRLGLDSYTTMSVSVFSLRTNSWKNVSLRTNPWKNVSLRTNPWKNVSTCGYRFGTSGIGALLHEAIHWPLRKQNGNYVIVAFDLVEERFRELPFPEDTTGFKFFHIRVLGGCLCLLRYNIRSVPKEFFIMKEYGVKESWTRAFILGPNDEVPLLFWKNSKKVLVINEKNLQLRNCNSSESEASEEFVVADIPNWKYLTNFEYANVYVESLVPPTYRNCN